MTCPSEVLFKGTLTGIRTQPDRVDDPLFSKAWHEEEKNCTGDPNKQKKSRSGKPLERTGRHTEHSRHTERQCAGRALALHLRFKRREFLVPLEVYLLKEPLLW